MLTILHDASSSGYILRDNFEWWRWLNNKSGRTGFSLIWNQSYTLLILLKQVLLQVDDDPYEDS